MAKLNFCANTSILKTRVNKYASSVMFRALAREKANTELQEAQEGLRKAYSRLESAKNLKGTVLYHEEDIPVLKQEVVDAILTVKEKEDKLAKISALPEARFSFNTDEDKALRKAWNNATTEAMKYTALKKWFNDQGVPGDDSGQLLELVRGLSHWNKNSAKKVILDGARHHGDAKLSFPILFAVMIDWHFDANQMKKDYIPQELRDIYEAQRAEAIKRREEKKAKKTNK